VTVQAIFGVPASWPLSKRDKALAGLLWPTGTPDYDNVAKIACDALNGIAFVNDSQIVKATVEKRYGEDSMLKVEISPLEIGLLERLAEVG
jgi:Holliday junction resolvase RusA-like endonuclease